MNGLPRLPSPRCALIAWLAGSIGVGIFPADASAHLVSTGMGPVYDGIGHLLLTPEDLLPVLAAAFYAGLRGAQTGRSFLFLLPAAWLAGGILGLQAGGAISFPLPAISIILTGLLVAADVRLPPRTAAVVIGIIGLLHGYLNGIILETGPGLAGLLGITGALFVLLSITSALVISLRQPWTRVAVRVLGSWTTAVGILMLGWHFAGGLAA